MNTEPGNSYRDIVSAYRLLFQEEATTVTGLTGMLDEVSLKHAYRNRVMDTHPDRAALLGREEEDLARDFKAVIEAYELLLGFTRLSRPAYRRPGAGADDADDDLEDESLFSGISDSFYRGGIPKTELLFGQYLYYSGKISWKTLNRAVLWQKNRRPRFGQIALEWGMLSRHDVAEILKNRHYQEKFGEYAQRKGYISQFQRMAIMGKQSMLQPRIGEYFVRKGGLTGEDIGALVKEQRLHNQQIRLRRRDS
ncbi:MAG TPA: hypothetical protein ENN21_01440 [Spirochaetes bacterium]|nr:hypothetical protein [Spirochaetota bacterium]